MITELAAATAEVFKWVNSITNESTQSRIDSEKSKAIADCDTFKKAILDCNTIRVDALLGSLQHGFAVSLTDAEIGELHQITPSLDGATLLSLFARARFADYAANVSDIINTQKSIGG